jgi:hypothetical protein
VQKKHNTALKKACEDAFRMDSGLGPSQCGIDEEDERTRRILGKTCCMNTIVLGRKKETMYSGMCTNGDYVL